MKEKNNKQKGITLVALVVTIIVLLVLSGITIVNLMGNNSIFEKARQAKIKTIEGNIKEQIMLSARFSEDGNNRK